MTPIEFSHVWKKYRVGSKHDSLRDAIPALLKRWTGRSGGQPQKGEFWALQDVSFQVAQGEILGIIGANGAGKSTILKLLSGITKETKGTARVQGRLAALIELGGGFHSDLTGAENIYLQGTMLGLRRSEIRKRFDSIVAFSELDSFLETPVKRYSSGMVVRLGFAIAAHVHPEVLLIDEVLAVGDLAFQQKCFKQIQQLKSQGAAMIFISHNLNAVESICDRALLLNHGQVELSGSVKEVSKAYRELVMARHRELVLKSGANGNGSSQELSSHPVAIREVEVLNGQGLPTQTVTTGEPLSVRIQYQAAQKIMHPVVSVKLERLDGVVCHEVSTQNQLPLDFLEGEGGITLTYAEFNLLPNTYWVSSTISEKGNSVPLAVAHRVGYFEVTSHLPDRGITHLKHSWESLHAV